MMVSRFGFLQSIADEAFQYFERVLMRKQEYAPYFDYKGLPIPWHIPAGVLYDLVAHDCLPWSLTVHFPSAMPQSLLPWITTESDKDTGLGPLRARIFSSIKEAAFICQGSDGGKIVNMMEVSKRDSLWDCMLRVDWTGYKNCADVMGIDPTILKGETELRRIPVRILLKKKLEIKEWSEDVKMYSRPIEVLEDGSSPALGEVMESIFPNLRFKDENGKGTVCEDMLRSSELFDESGEEEEPNDSTSTVQGDQGLASALVCGIAPSLDVPLAWLYSKMHSPDFFLYIVLGMGMEYFMLNTGFYEKVAAIESERLEEDWETTGRQRIEFWQEVSRQAEDKNVKLPDKIIAVVKKN